jgi:hypothetical protein
VDQIRYSTKLGGLVVRGESVRDSGDAITIHRNAGGFFAGLDRVGDVSLRSLQTALRAAAADEEAFAIVASSYVETDAVASLLVSTEPDRRLDHKYSGATDTWFELWPSGELLLAVQVVLTDETWTTDRVAETLEPMLRETAARFHHAAAYGEAPYPEVWPWTVWIEPRLSRGSVVTGQDLGRSIVELLSAADTGEGLTAELSARLVAAGQVSALLGQPETAWLEAKVQLWDLTSEAGKIELGQDVTRFANSTVTALLVVGCGTKKIDGIDTLVRGPGIALSRRDVDRVHKSIDARVHPPIDDLEVGLAEDGRGGQLLYILVPQQPEELKPFLVHGAIVDGRVEGGFFSIVRRRGEHSIPISPEALHSSISAGRALLRNGGGLSGPPDSADSEPAS